MSALGARAGERDEHHGRLLSLELVHGADAHAGGHLVAQRPYLCVVGRDDEDVGGRQRPRPAVSSVYSVPSGSRRLQNARHERAREDRRPGAQLEAGASWPASIGAVTCVA
jgi:hypothetical protein